MTKHKRIILWITLMILFFVLTPSIILYSQGYRIDWQVKRIVQTGALYLKIIPAKANILIDGKTSKTTDFFFGSTLLGNLFPGSHKIQISKEGYQPWAKQLDVQEKQVTDAKNIILFPKNPEFSIAADRIQQVWKTPKDNNTLLLQKNTQDGWKLVLFNTTTLREETIFASQKKDTPWDIQWSPDAAWLILQVAARENIQSFVLSLEKGQPCNTTPCSLDFLGQPLDAVAFFDAADHKIVFSKYARNSIILGEADFVQKEILAPFANNVLAFAMQGSTLLWLENSGTLWQKNASQNPPRAIASLSSPAQEETEYSIRSFGDVLFLQEGTRLLKVNMQEKNMQEMFSEARIIAGSPDAKKLAVSSGSELWVVYLHNTQDQPMHAAGDKVFLTRMSKTIDNLFWVSSHYLAFSAGEDIRALEIDERDAVNTAYIAQYPSPNLFWQEASKALAVLSQGNLYVSEILVK